MSRKQNFQTISWFWDLYQRDRLDLDPPYQRRSVWNQIYKNYFIDTILLKYPSPAIFLYEEIEPDGKTHCHVVDGKQRLITIFEFVTNQFPVPENATLHDIRGKYFRDLSDDVKTGFWGYPFSVEYIPTEDQTVIDNIFDRINRNTAKLTPQELRHAKYSGVFINSAEDLSSWMTQELGDSFPRIAVSSRRQMKDVELVAHLLLLIESGPLGYSTADLDIEFSKRDEEWEEKIDVERRFRCIISVLSQMIKGPRGEELERSRLRNQADFYSLFGAIDQIINEGNSADPENWTSLALDFANKIDSEEQRKEERAFDAYYEAARAASNDSGSRQKRIMLMKCVLSNTPFPEDIG